MSWAEMRKQEKRAPAKVDEPVPGHEPEPIEGSVSREEAIQDALESYTGRYTQDGRPYLQDFREHSGIEDVEADELE